MCSNSAKVYVQLIYLAWSHAGLANFPGALEGFASIKKYFELLVSDKIIKHLEVLWSMKLYHMF